MPAGRHKQQTKRHDGGVSRVCPICDHVGARVVYGLRGGKIVWAHRRCILQRHGRDWDKPKLADAIMAGLP